MRQPVERSRQPLYGVRVGAFVLTALVWALLSARNERLRAESLAMIQRAKLNREIQAYRVSTLEAQSLLPEAGSGDPTWWKERLSREIAKRQLTLFRYDAKPDEAPVGPHPIARRELVVGGPFEGVLRLIGWLETSAPRVRIERFSLEPTPPGAVRLSLSLLLPGPREAR